VKFATTDAAKPRRARASEAVILFCIANQTFAIAADAVQEIRSTDSLGGTAIEIEQAEVPKVRHLVERARRTYYVVSGCAHFGLRVTRPTLVLILRQIRANQAVGIADAKDSGQPRTKAAPAAYQAQNKSSKAD